MRRTPRPSFRSASRVTASTALLAVTLLLSTGCGADRQATHASGDAMASGMHDDHSGMSMTPEQMAAMGSTKGPSSSATMICGAEIAESVQKTFQLDSRPTGTHRWSADERLYTCSYPVGSGRLELSVQDATGGAEGRAHFAMLRRTLPGAQRLSGLEALGFPSFTTSAGDAVFLKDGKTLRVDPSGVRASDLPTGFSRGDAAYGVAASVIACWKE